MTEMTKPRRNRDSAESSDKPRRVREKPKDTRDLRGYVVTAAGFVYRTGKGRNDVRRFRKGAKLRLDANDERTITAVRGKLIAEMVEGKVIKATTARQVVAAFGAADDPAKPPIQEVQPIKPSANDMHELA